MKKPSAFQILDFLSFGLVAIFSIAAAVFVISSDVVIEAKLLTSLCALVFLGIYLRIIHLRHLSLSKFEWFPQFGFMVDKDVWSGSLDGMDEIIRSTVEGWKKAEGYDAYGVVEDKVVWVFFKPAPITRIRNRIVDPKNGYTVARGYDLVIGFKETDKTLQTTSFAHELGHLIQGHATGNWDEATHHERAKKHNLP